MAKGTLKWFNISGRPLPSHTACNFAALCSKSRKARLAGVLGTLRRLCTMGIRPDSFGLEIISRE